MNRRFRSAMQRWTGAPLPQRLLLSSLTFVLWIGLASSQIAAQEAEWIWWPEHPKDAVPSTSCHFRKTFTVRRVESGQVLIAADDVYELYVNGRKVGSGESARKLDKYDITRQLTPGRNLIAIEVRNVNGATAALAARVLVKPRDGNWRSFSTDRSWRTNLRPLPFWNTPLYNDNRWARAQSFGKLGDTVPWDRQEGVATTERHKSERFKISQEFEVQRILDDDATGSLIAMAFNEFGHLLASREGGPLLLLYDSDDEDQELDKIRIYCDQVKNCQGILPLNGEVYVTAEGPEGAALYRLADRNRDGRLEEVKSIVKFGEELGEHGPHGLTLGPDGLLYVIVGNHASPQQDYDASSPHANYYEGDLVDRYEDPGGHAVGVKVPGGVVLRTDVDGSRLQLVAGGIRNAYDLAFSRDGELFTYDSDMESDIGTGWYRPTRVLHVTEGAEFGWRSGWSKWPNYYVDSLPPMIETGRGSPTGVVFYNHYNFPARYHNTLFVGDWSEGRILAIRLQPDGGSYRAESEVFLSGQPLNVTDLDVGPDGWLYFVTGGRATSGGVFRVRWRGTPPESVTKLGSGVNGVIRQPQLFSAHGRQKVATLRQDFDSENGEWERTMRGVALSSANPPAYRTRAMDLMQLFGPSPSPDLLIQLSRDRNERVRAKAAALMGLQPDPQTRSALLDLLADDDGRVRRRACESLLRAQHPIDADKLLKILASTDRFEAWAGRRLLERTPVEQWRDVVLSSSDHRVFVQGALALVIAHPEKENGVAVMQRAGEIAKQFVTDRNFIDMLRVMQVAVHRCELEAADVPQMAAALAEEFPSGDTNMNREVIRLLIALQVDSIMDRYLDHLKSDAPAEEKLLLALQLRFLKTQWKADDRLAVLEFLENAKLREGGGSYAHYVMNVIRDFSKDLTESERRIVLARGAEWPNAALGALYGLPAQVDADTLGKLRRLDLAISEWDDDSIKPLKVGIVAVLSRSGDKESLSFLRGIWERDPERRQAVAMGLALHPHGVNWEYLVRSLTIVEGDAARDLLRRLAQAPLTSDDPQHLRQVILLGLKLQDNGSQHAIALLEHWTGEKLSQSDTPWEEALQAWQLWFAEKYPHQPEAILPEISKDGKWTLETILTHFRSEPGKRGSYDRGMDIYVKAQCNKCHRMRGTGESLGPDLTSISKRFTRKEILESILFPSHVISDQYASKTVITDTGRSYTGIVAPGGEDESVVLQPNGEKVTINNNRIEEILPSKKSAMPDGLLDNLTLKEISDLFTYLGVIPAERLANKPEAVGSRR